MFDKNNLRRWFADDGDNTHILNHDLTEKSMIIDIGAYKGIWAEKMIAKFNPYILLFEPVPDFIKILNTKFANQPKVTIFPYGVHPKPGYKSMSINQDASAISELGEQFYFISPDKLPEADLLQINIEGAEYDLLDYMITSGIITRMKILQVQFHNISPDCAQRHDVIRLKLQELGYREKYCYAFVWECWTRILKN